MAEPLTAAEAWFRAQGLPWFVAADRQEVRDALRWSRLVPWAAVAVAAAVGAVLGAVAVLDDDSDAWVAGVTTVALAGGVYALLALRLGPVLRWAAGYTFRSLGLLVPLATRALPLLLLFITFLFINAEVWQVASGMSRGLLWLSVLFFGLFASAFLLVRLPEEVKEVERDVAGERLVACCAGTPVEQVAPEVAETHPDVRLTAMPRANLVLALLFAQAVQVLLLSVSVYVFFLLFGSVTVGDDIIESWVGAPPTALPSLGQYLPVSNELMQVSAFLAAFSGLYFTVYAVSDPTYREQFFTRIAHDLERAIGVHVVYETLRTRSGATE